MNDRWKDVIITKAVTAVNVKKGTGNPIHKNRSSHGFVLNIENSTKDYLFSDGNIMRTNEFDLFYLPKGSSYEVKSIEKGSCFAINFDADISDEPFCIPVKSYDSAIKIFKEAEKAWRQQMPNRNMITIKCVYELILLLEKEMQRAYVPTSQDLILAPALKLIQNSFCDNSLSVSNLAKECEISEVYLRRLFLNKFGVSPKEYILNMRISYAKQLLRSGQFSINEVANICGYTENCHFSREFKKRTGLTPSQAMG